MLKKRILLFLLSALLLFQALPVRALADGEETTAPSETAPLTTDPNTAANTGSPNSYIIRIFQTSEVGMESMGI